MHIPRILLVALAAGFGSHAHAGQLKVVATLSTFADLAETIGGDHVKVSYVAPPKFNPHFIEPRPSDVLKVKRADLLLHGGLDLEAWRDPLLDAAGNPRFRAGGDRQVSLSQGIHLLEVPDAKVSRAHGDIHLYGNPHFWVAPENGRIIARTIASSLSRIDAAHAEDYRDNLQRFEEELDGRLASWTEKLEPFKGRELVAHHNEWPYFLAFAGLQVHQFLEPKPGIPPSPRHLAKIQQYIEDHAIPAIIETSYLPQKPARELVRRTGCRVALLCQNVGERPEAKDYLSMIDYNVRQIVEALK